MLKLIAEDFSDIGSSCLFRMLRTVFEPRQKATLD